MTTTDDELENYGPDRVYAWDDYDGSGNVRNEMTVREIYNSYYPWWKGKLKSKQEKYNCFSEEEFNRLLRFDVCMLDFIAVNYAREKKPTI